MAASAAPSITSANPILDALTPYIENTAREAIIWFDTAKRADNVAKVAFIFTFSKYVNPARSKKGEEETIDWFKEEQDGFQIHKKCGPAFDRYVDEGGREEYLAANPDCPREPTASLPAEQIVAVNDIVEEAHLIIGETTNQKIISIILAVRLFNDSDVVINSKEWTIYSEADKATHETP